MAKRSLEDVFNNDPLGLLDVAVTKSKKLNNYAIYFDTFKELEDFIEANGREPDVEAVNIHEAKLAARLSKLRSTPEALEDLAPFDTKGLLGAPAPENKSQHVVSMDDIFSSDLLKDDDDIFNLTHVTSVTKKQTASQDMATRKKCIDFESFKPLFQQMQRELDDGKLDTSGIKGVAEIQKGQAFILSGLIAYVAEVGEKYERRKGHHNARLRVVYSNGMESNLLLRSFGAALYKDKSARVISGRFLEPMDSRPDNDLVKSGTVYVLRSLSNHPSISTHKEYLHKIGITTSDVKSRITSANKDATYLLADVEVVAEFTLYNFDLRATERLLHVFFKDAQADIVISDRFGQPVKPQEWFFLPLELIKQAIRLIQDGIIQEYKYCRNGVSILKK